MEKIKAAIQYDSAASDTLGKPRLRQLYEEERQRLHGPISADVHCLNLILASVAMAVYAALHFIL